MDPQNPRKSSKSFPARGHNAPSQPWVPNTKSQPASPLVYLHVIHWRGAQHIYYWEKLLKEYLEKGEKTVGKKEGPKIERSNTFFFTLISSACFPWHSCGQTASFLDWNPKEKHRTKNASQRQLSTFPCSGTAELMCLYKKEQRAFSQISDAPRWGSKWWMWI